MNKGLNDDELEKIINETEKNFKEDFPNPNNNAQVIQYNQRKKEVEDLKAELKAARGMKNSDWSRGIIKKTLENAMVAQHIAVSEVEDVYQSNKIQTLAEISNVIVSGAKALTDIDIAEKTIEIQQERNNIRKLEMRGDKGELLAEGQAKMIGTGKDILRLMKAELLEEQKDINNSK
jgi:hypothetical protein